jgi:hypothetical protein
MPADRHTTVRDGSVEDDLACNEHAGTDQDMTAATA